MLNYGRHSIDQDDIDSVVAVLNSDYLTQGPIVERFEAALAERVGSRFAVAVSSGTAALHIACLAVGLTPETVGLTSAITFVATANAVHYCGSCCRILDIEPQTLGLALPSLETALQQLPETRAVLPVHFAGLAADMAPIRQMCGDRAIIEDASHALGGSYVDGRPVGCGDHADLTVFSFHPVKPITAGEGGAVVTNNPELARRLRLLRSHGIEREASRFADSHPGPWHYEQHILGFNYRITDIQAALGLSQLGKLDQFVARRRQIALAYDEAFADLTAITPIQTTPDQRARSAHHLYVVRGDFAKMRTTRQQFMAHLRKRGIGTQVHYIPVHHHPYHQQHSERDPLGYANAEAYFEQCLTLPLHMRMTDADIESVIAAVREIVECAS